MASAILRFVLSGNPQLILTTMPGDVVLLSYPTVDSTGAYTETIVHGTGTGGVDQSTGQGLSLPTLTQNLATVFFPTVGGTPMSKAEEWSNAIHNYFKLAITKTTDVTAKPRPAPPPVGPATGPTRATSPS
jgi:hypothetical protein